MLSQHPERKPGDAISPRAQSSCLATWSHVLHEAAHAFVMYPGLFSHSPASAHAPHDSLFSSSHARGGGGGKAIALGSEPSSASLASSS